MMYTTRTLARLCPAAALLLALVGCAYRAYDGPARPSDEVAYLIPNARESRIGTIITSMGGRRIDRSQGKLEILAGPTSLDLLVLPERVDISPDGGSMFAQQRVIDNYERAIETSVRFDARPGVTYAFDGRYDTVAGRATLQVIDRATRSVVAEATAPSN